MNNTSQTGSGAPASQIGSSWKKKLITVFLVLIACCGVTAAATAWWVKRNVYAQPFPPVTLTQSEQNAYDEKLGALAAAAGDGRSAEQRAEDAKRTLIVTDKEINAYIAKQGLGEQVKVELSSGNASATLITPVDSEVPLLGGKTFRIRVGLAAGSGTGGKNLSFSISDVSIGGVPVPNAWLGDIKGVNLLADNAGNDPVVRRFLAGIREFEIKGGAIRVLLNE